MHTAVTFEGTEGLESDGALADVELLLNAAGFEPSSSVNWNPDAAGAVQPVTGP